MLFDSYAAQLAKHRCQKKGDMTWFHQTGQELCDRLLDVKRSFAHALEIGSQQGIMRSLIGANPDLATKVENLDTCGWYPTLLEDKDILVSEDPKQWPFTANAYDLIISNCVLHRLEDPLQHLQACRVLLKPDGLFLAILPGESNLVKAGRALIEAELSIHNKVHPRIHPRISMTDLWSLLARCGFVLPVFERISDDLAYPDVIGFAHALRACGETNVLDSRSKTFSPRALFTRWQEEIERKNKPHLDAANKNAKYKFDIELIVALCWSPGSDQPTSLRPGSGRVSLAKVVDNSTDPK